VRGVTPAGHLTDPDPLESEVKRAMVRRAQRATLLVDGSKFGRAALTQIATLERRRRRPRPPTSPTTGSSRSSAPASTSAGSESRPDAGRDAGPRATSGSTST
jgi:hypothetical protein